MPHSFPLDARPAEAAVLLDRLRHEHREIDDKVGQFERRPWLTADEDVEVKRLKRLKLAKKDMIFLLERRLARS